MACMLLVDTYMKHSGNRDFQIDLTPTVLMNRTVPLTNPQKRTGMGSLFRSRWLGGVFMYPLLMEFHSFCQVFCFLLSVILSETFPVHRSVWYMYQAVPDNFGNVFAMERLPFSPIYFDRRIMWELGNPHSDLYVCYF